ncbi:MAG: DUF4160 domain-containing protein [Chloroflexi bacterium]|nr:DUF4160 domain-containing protein [Chloroflexota bacterium]
MPELSRFYGIVIQMYPREHGLPHFHARYSGATAIIGIANLYVYESDLPRRALSLVHEWAELHQGELGECWDRIRNGQEPGKIDPLP